MNSPTRSKPSTFLAPGQRYGDPHWPAWRTERQLTIVRVGWDAGGRPWVVYRGPDGQEAGGPVAWFEAAVAAGELVPVIGPGPIARS
jgi:hypothetical protein